MDYLSIGPVPCEEECAQVGQEDYYKVARVECEIFAGQLVRALGDPPANTWFAVKSFPHEFGSYLEVVCKYNEDDEVSTSYAFNAESNSPVLWDEQSLKELAERKSKLSVPAAQSV